MAEPELLKLDPIPSPLAMPPVARELPPDIAMLALIDKDPDGKTIPEPSVAVPAVPSIYWLPRYSELTSDLTVELSVLESASFLSLATSDLLIESSLEPFWHEPKESAKTPSINNRMVKLGSTIGNPLESS